MSANFKKFLFTSSLIFTVYSVLTVIFTWPLVPHLSTSTYGYSGDNFGFMYYLWWWRYVRKTGLDLHFSPLQEAPFGKIIYPETGNVAYFWPIKLLALLTNEVAGYNLLLLLSFLLAGMAMFLLCREVLSYRIEGHSEFISESRISKMLKLVQHDKVLAAFVGGLIFAFCPYHLWKAYNHLDLCLIYVVPLFLWAWVRFERTPSVKRAAVLGLAAFLTIITNYYYAFFTGLMAVGLFIGRRIQEGTFSKKLLKGYLFAIFVTGLLSFPFVKTTLSGIKGPNPYGASDIYNRPLENLLLLSTRPWDYLIPSQDHPIFGSAAKSLIKKIETLSNDFKTQPGPPHERTIFLGYFAIIGALYSIYYAIKRKISFEFYFPFWFAVCLLILISFPPFIYLKGVKILFPTYFLHQIFPMFRSYSRLGLYVLALMTPLAILSFDRLLQEFQKSAQKIAITCAAGAFVLFEFLNFPPAKIINFSNIPPSYQWLAEQKEEFIIAEYPKLFSLADGYMFQRIHLKPIFNLHGWSPYYKLWDWMENFYSAEAIDKLDALGVRYVLIHKELLFPQENPVDDLWSARALKEPLKYDEIPENLVLVKDFKETAIFEVRVDPAPIMGVVFEEGGRLVVSWSKKEWSWYGSHNKIYLMNLADREMEVKFGFEDAGGVEKLVFNGNALQVEKSDGIWELTLAPGENTVEIISDIPYQFSRMPRIEL